MNSTCGDDLPPESVPVCSSHAILRYCVQGCDYYSEQWYRQTESGEEYITDGQDLVVIFNNTQQNYSCGILPFSFGCDSASKGHVSLIKGVKIVLHASLNTTVH